MEKLGILELIIIFIIIAAPIAAVLIMVIYKSNKKKKINQTSWNSPDKNVNQKNDLI